MTDPGWDIPGVPRDEPPSQPAPGPQPSAPQGLTGPQGLAADTDVPPEGSARSGRRAASARTRQATRAAMAAATGAFSPAACAARTARSAALAEPAAGGPATADSTVEPAADRSTAAAGLSSAAAADRAASQTHSWAGAAGDGSGTDGPTGSGPAADMPGAAGSGRDDPADGAQEHGGGAGSGTGVPGAGDTARIDSAVQALACLDAALDFLAHADPADWPEGVQADCLRALAVAESRQAAAHARVLSAFSAPGGGLAGDGHRSPRVWLTWQTQATRRAAASTVGWMRRLNAHPALAASLAAGQLSVSWARQLADWTDRLPESARAAADEELLTAAGRGAALSDLFLLAEQQLREHAEADTDDDGFTDRSLRLGRTFEGTGRLEGDLTARCAAAVTAVLESLSAVRGPEDERTVAQRQHDALEDACLRLLAAGCLPQRAGQPVRLDLQITLQELADNADGTGCDALIQPVITGHVDYGLLEKMADPGYLDQLAAATADYTAAQRHGAVLEQAVKLLSGPGGRAAMLRARLAGGPATPLSLPLDMPGTYDTIPIHLRRAVRKRDKHCRFPGCDMPPDACDVHHIKHRKDGGRHALTNLTLLCRFHHHIAIHRWGWTITMHADGTTTARSPDGTKTLHSHPTRAAA